MTDDQIARLADAVAERLAKDDRLGDAVYKRFKENALGEINARFDKLDKRFDGIEDHLKLQDTESAEIKKRVGHLYTCLDDRGLI